MKELETIKKAVDKSFGIDIAKNSRKIDYVMGRMVYYKLSKDFTKYSLKIIGEKVGRDHATVIHSCKTFGNDILKNHVYCKKYSDNYSFLKVIFPEVKQELVEEEKNSTTILELVYERESLRHDILRMKWELRDSIKLADREEVEMISLFRELDFDGRRDAMFKIKTAKKVREKLSISIAS